MEVIERQAGRRQSPCWTASGVRTFCAKSLDNAATTL